MPAKKESNVPDGGRNVPNGMPSFIRCELSDADRKTVKENVFSDKEAFVFISTLCDGGFKVSLSFETQNDCYAAFITGGKGTGDAFRGKCLASRGATLVGSITVAAYKHVTLLKEDWSSVESMGSGDQWG